MRLAFGHCETQNPKNP